LHGYVLPLNVATHPDFNAGDVEQWKSHSQAVPYTLSMLFLESKITLGKKLMARINNKTLHQYIVWIQQQEDIFDAFIAMNGALPKHLSGPVAYLLNTQWDAAILTLSDTTADETIFLELRSLWDQAHKYGISLDYTATIPFLHTLISDELKTFCVNFTTASIDRMRFFLNIIDRFAIPVQKAGIEDTFYTVFSTSISTWYDQYVAEKDPAPEQKSLLIQILQFARRMNFNTDRFEIS
jgi:hypothetical protein